MKVVRFLLASLLLLSIAGCSGTADKGNGATRTIVLITVDGLIPDRVGAFGGEIEAPHLEELATMSSVWPDALTAVPMARPAVATYLTGLAPDRHGVRDDLFTPLAEDVPTLAARLSEAGYRTAAFPGSSHLGWSSGLLGAFEIVDDPPVVPISAGRWLPSTRPPDLLGENVGKWLGSLPEDARSFTWVHLSYPLMQQLMEPAPFRLTRIAETKPKEEWPEEPELPAQAKYEAAIGRMDEVVGVLLEALRSRNWLDDSLVILAGTQADQRGGEAEPFGSGYSLHPRAVRVPVLLHRPAGAPEARSAEQAVWAPDVPATIAESAGIELGDRAEGVSLFADSDPDRVLLSWSWGAWDQMRWPVLRTAVRGASSYVEGFDGPAVSGSAGTGGADASSLGEVLQERESLATPATDVSALRPLLEGRGLRVEPGVSGGELPDAVTRTKAARLLWAGRRALVMRSEGAARLNLRRAADFDEENLAVLLDRGQTMVLVGMPEGLAFLGRAVELYPEVPEAVHWYAHAIWGESLDDAEALLELILPVAPLDGDVHYDLACARSLNDDLPAAQEHLRAAIEAGFRRWDLMASDPDLRLLRESLLYSEVLAEYNR